MPSSSSSNESSVSNGLLSFSTFAVAVGSLVGSFSISLALARKKNPDFSMKPIEKQESPGRLAARALGWGTMLACSGVFSLVILTGYLTGASNVSD